MRVGIHVDMRNPPRWHRPWAAHYGRWLERLEEAEHLGADITWLTEHHFFDDGYLPQCWTFAAAIAARTRRMRLGTAVSLLPLHHPVDLAEQIAMVDVISDGRVEPGFGVGYRQPEYAAFDGDPDRRYRTFDARIGVLRQLWGEAPGASRHVTPPPLQAPMPMWAGFGGPRGARLAGRLGLGLHAPNREVVPEYLAASERAGSPQPPPRLSWQFECFVADDPDEAWSAIEPHVIHRWASYDRYRREGTAREGGAARSTIADAARRRILIGTAEQVVSLVREQIDGLPVTDLYTFADFPGMPDDMVDAHVARTFGELAPRLRSIDAPATNRPRR